MKRYALLLWGLYTLSLANNDWGVRFGLPPGLLAQMEQFESGGGAGTELVYEVIDRRQLFYLQKIAQGLRQPLTYFRGNQIGAMGVMQIIPSTFYLFAQDGDGDGWKDPLNAEDNRATAAYYLAWLRGRHQSLRKAVEIYTGVAPYTQQLIF